MAGLGAGTWDVVTPNGFAGAGIDVKPEIAAVPLSKGFAVVLKQKRSLLDAGPANPNGSLIAAGTGVSVVPPKPNGSLIAAGGTSVSLCTLRVFSKCHSTTSHIFIESVRLPDTRRFPSGCQLTELTELVCPVSVFIKRPSPTSQILMDLS